MTVYVVMDRVCEADIVVGVFSTKDKAQAFIRANKDRRVHGVRAYDCLDIEIHDLDSMEVAVPWGLAQVTK